MNKVAILVDWENIRERIFNNSSLLRENTPKFSYHRDTSKLPQFFLQFLEVGEEKPYRIFFYLAEPYKNKRYNFPQKLDSKLSLVFL